MSVRRPLCLEEDRGAQDEVRSSHWIAGERSRCTRKYAPARESACSSREEEGGRAIASSRLKKSRERRRMRGEDWRLEGPGERGRKRENERIGERQGEQGEGARERAERGNEKDAENGRVERGGNERRMEEEGRLGEVKTWKCSMAVGDR